MTVDHDFKQAYDSLTHIAYDIIKPYLDGCKYVEGNILSTTEFIPKIYNIYDTAKACNNTMRALDIGFNAGFSTILMLLSNPNLHVDAIDIGQHSYVDWCAKVVSDLFPQRFLLIKGDSKDVLPTLQEGAYDMIHIDGDHSVYGATIDLHNAIRLATPRDTVIIMDDTDIPHITEIWNTQVATGRIRQECLKASTPFHTIGTVSSVERKYAH